VVILKKITYFDGSAKSKITFFFFAFCGFVRGMLNKAEKSTYFRYKLLINVIYIRSLKVFGKIGKTEYNLCSKTEYNLCSENRLFYKKILFPDGNDFYCCLVISFWQLVISFWILVISFWILRGKNRIVKSKE